MTQQHGEEMTIQITKDWLRPHKTCLSGLRWFSAKFPEGGEFEEVYKALRADGRYDDSDWLCAHVFMDLPLVESLPLRVKIYGADKAVIEAEVAAGALNCTTGDWTHAATTGKGAHAAATGKGAHAAATGDSAHAATTGYSAHAATTGYSAHAATTGDHARAATTGEGAHAAATGDSAHAATTGDSAHAATTGYSAHAATTGDHARAATTGYSAHAATTGTQSIAAAIGFESTACAGEDGAIVLAYFDGTRPRLVVGYVGENGIKAGVVYKLDDDHRLIAVDAFKKFAE